MILDAVHEFGEDFSVAAMNATDVLAMTNSFDLSPSNHASVSRDLSTGGQLWFYLICTETVDGAATATLTVEFVTDATTTLDASSIVHWTSGAVGADFSVDASPGFIAGDITQFPLPFGGGLIPEYDQFMGVVFTNLTADLSQGAFSAGLTRGPIIQRVRPTAANYV